MCASTCQNDIYVDMIRGVAREGSSAAPKCANQVVVLCEENGIVVVGVNSADRPGLLLDISKALLVLNLMLNHSEASVVGDRSVSVWRCGVIDGKKSPEMGELWTVLHEMLENDPEMAEIGYTKESLVRCESTDRLREIAQMEGKTKLSLDYCPLNFISF